MTQVDAGRVRRRVGGSCRENTVSVVGVLFQVEGLSRVLVDHVSADCSLVGHILVVDALASAIEHVLQIHVDSLSVVSRRFDLLFEHLLCALVTSGIAFGYSVCLDCLTQFLVVFAIDAQKWLWLCICLLRCERGLSSIILIPLVGCCIRFET